MLSGLWWKTKIYGVKSSGTQFGSRAELNPVTRTSYTSTSIAGNYYLLEAMEILRFLRVENPAITLLTRFY